MPPRMTPLRAIRKKCLECSGGDKQEVQDCVLVHCPLHVYRFGLDPHEPATLLKEQAAEPKEAQPTLDVPEQAPEARDPGPEPLVPAAAQQSQPEPESVASGAEGEAERSPGPEQALPVATPVPPVEQTPDSASGGQGPAGGKRRGKRSDQYSLL